MREPVLITGALIGSRELVTERGEDAAKLARQVGLPARVFDEPDLFVPAGQIVDFLELAAQTLGMSPRSLQRRLAAAGTGFRELLEQVRADLAWRQVARTDLSFARVAELLGYDSQAAFTRAFKRWYGVTPREARLAG